MNEEKGKIKSGYVAIVGRPNVGKSTLLNRIAGQKVAITSNKPQTTREKILAVYTEERGQIIFLDTPGINRAKNKLGQYMNSASLSAFADSDVILWLVEPGDYIGVSEQFIEEELKKANVPVILAMNKTDTVKRDALLGFIAAYNKTFDFAEVVPVSAKTGENISVLIGQIFKYLPEGPLYFDEETLTDQPMRRIAAEIIREKALYCLKDEVPHGIAVVTDKYHERKKQSGAVIADIEATIVCEKNSHKGIIIGKGGEMLKKIGSAARYELEKMTGEQVNLKLWVKVRKDWRDSDIQLKNFGYDKRKL